MYGRYRKSGYKKKSSSYSAGFKAGMRKANYSKKRSSRGRRYGW